MANLVNFNKGIVNDCGASYNMLTGEFNPNHGFMVSIKGHEKTYNADKNSFNYEIADFINGKAILLLSGISENYDKIFLGGWIDNGLLYLDVSFLVDTETEAIKMAKDNEQLAYFNNTTKETIYI
jgi:hypothetical protein